MTSFVAKWLGELCKENPDSSVQKAISETTIDGQLDDERLFRQLIEIASDSGEGEDVVSD